MWSRSTPVVAIAALACGSASAQELEELLASHYEARGGLERIRAVESMRIEGTMTIGPGMEAPVILEVERPDRMRLEFVLQGMRGIQAYDGDVGWTLFPFDGSDQPEPMSSEELALAAEQADIEGSLVDWREKGHRLELLGRDPVGGGDAWKLRLTLAGGQVRHVWLDAGSFLEVRREGRVTVRGTETEAETSYGDYREVDGLMIPFVVENGATGQPGRQRLVVESVELDVPIDDVRFAMPATVPAEEN